MFLVPSGRRVVIAFRRYQPYIAPAVNLGYQVVGRYLRNRVDNYIAGGNNRVANSRVSAPSSRMVSRRGFKRKRFSKGHFRSKKRRFSRVRRRRFKVPRNKFRSRNNYFKAIARSSVERQGVVWRDKELLLVAIYN